MDSENLKLLLNKLSKSDEMSEIEELRTKINSYILSSNEGKQIKSFIDWNTSVDVHIQSVQNRLMYPGIDHKVFSIMDDLISELYSDSRD